jgi:uncharacterized protein (DUF433 family)
MENKNELLARIIIDSNIMVGKPIVKGTRITVQQILGLLGQGITIDEIIKEYAKLKKEDILACLMFATETLENTTFVPLAKG